MKQILKIFRRLLDRILCYLAVVLMVLGVLAGDKKTIISSAMFLILMTYFSIVIEPRMDSIEEFKELLEEIRVEKSKEKGEKKDKKINGKFVIFNRGDNTFSWSNIFCVGTGTLILKIRSIEIMQ